MRTIPLSAVKAKLSEIADEVDQTHERVMVTKNGRDYVIVVAAEDLRSLEATLDLLADPEAQQRLVESEAEIAGEQGLTEPDVLALTERLGERRGGRHRR